MCTHWDEGLIAACIADAVTNVSASMVISFDACGVSGHTNHRAVHCGLRRLMLERRTLDISFEAWQLVSAGLLRKFMGVLDAPLSMREAAAAPDSVVCYRAVSPMCIMGAMGKHRSQWVWFRKLFVVFSRYTYVNTLQRMAVGL